MYERFYEFHWWMIIAPLLLAVIMYLGATQYRLIEKSNQNGDRKMVIQRRFNDKLLTLVSRIATAVVGIMFIWGSGLDIIKMLDSFLIEGESDVWSIVLAPFVVIIIVGGYSCACYCMAKLMSWMKCGFLYEQRNRIMSDCNRYNGKHTKTHESILG